MVEKETKIKETMKIMGLSGLAYNLSWFITMMLQSISLPRRQPALASRLRAPV